MTWSSSAKRKIRQFLALPWSDRWLILGAGFLLLPAARVATRLVRWSPEAEKETPDSAGSPSPSAVQRARDTARLVRIAGRYGPVRSTCLERSVATKWILGRRGIPTSIRVGVCRREGRLEAHAWVECDGVVVDDAPDIRTRFHPLPAAIAARGLRFS